MNFDVVIVGGGMVGASFAGLLGDSGLRIGVIDSRAPMSMITHEHDPRVSAITLASRNLFQNLRMWESVVDKHAVPVEAMQIWEAHGEIRFDAAEIGESCLAYIVQNQTIQRALIERIQSFANIHPLWPTQIDTINFDEAQATLTLKDGRRLTTRLVVGADGADSAVRRFAGIETRNLDLNQKGIVTTVRTERPHKRVARQRFLQTGPLAFLPLADPNACSIVWSADTARAEALMELSDTAFVGELQTAFGDVLGNILSASRRQAFALALSQARRYTATRLALIGDAAHTVHPLAGQGVNLGLLDAAVLAEHVLASVRHRRDPGMQTCLRRYERGRKGENLTMIAVTGGFKYLFGSQLSVVRGLRTLGLNMVDVATPVKRFIMRRAAGLSDDVPSLARSHRSVK